MSNPALALPEQTDLELAAAWQRGDERAATALVRRHAPGLARFIASQGVQDGVEELVQDTFVRAFDALPGFRGESSLTTWLFTIARRLVLDRQRAASRARRHAELDDALVAPGGDPLDALVASDLERRLLAAVQGLSRRQREVFTLRVSEGLAYKEIAEVLGMSEGAARVHYHGALRAVKERLDDGM